MVSSLLLTGGEARSAVINLHIDRTIAEELNSTSKNLPTLMLLENISQTTSVLEIEFVVKENINVWKDFSSRNKGSTNFNLGLARGTGILVCKRPEYIHDESVNREWAEVCKHDCECNGRDFRPRWKVKPLPFSVNVILFAQDHACGLPRGMRASNFSPATNSLSVSKPPIIFPLMYNWE